MPQRRTQRKGGPGARARIPKAKLAPQALSLQEQGFTVAEIAAKLNRSKRYIQYLLAHARLQGDGMVFIVPDPIEPQRLESEVARTVVFDVDGFERFFNRYSGRKLAKVHKEWVRQALLARRVLINCPPRHAKSTIFTVWFTIWLVAMNRDMQVLIVSQTERLARKFTNEIAYHLTYNDSLIQDFGRFKPELEGTPWRPNSGELLVEGRRREVKSGDLTVQVRGSNQQILGMETDWLIADDPVSRAISESETERRNQSEWFHGDVMSRLEPGSSAIVIGQRLHMHDLYGELAKEKTYDSKEPSWLHLNYPAILDWDTRIVLWPEKWTFEALMQAYQDVGQDIFESMYQQNPLSESKRLARRAWLYGDDEHPGCIDTNRLAGQGIKGSKGYRDRPIVRVLSIDPSPTRYAGLLVADILRDNRVFEAHVIEAVRQPMTVRDLLREVDRVLTSYNPDYFIFEQNAAQRWFLQDPAMNRIRRQMRVVPHNTGRNKGDPVLGVESLAVEFEFGRLRFPYGDAESKEMTERFFEEARNYPQGITDDLLMAMWFIKFNYMRLLPLEEDAESNRQRALRIPPRLAKGWQWWTKGQPTRKTWQTTQAPVQLR